MFVKKVEFRIISSAIGNVLKTTTYYFFFIPIYKIEEEQYGNQRYS